MDERKPQNHRQRRDARLSIKFKIAQETMPFVVIAAQKAGVTVSQYARSALLKQMREEMATMPSTIVAKHASTICDRDAIRAEAFEEAAKICDELSRISDGVLAVTGNGGQTNFIGDAHRACAAAIRAKAKRGLALAEHARMSGELLGSEVSDGARPCR